MIKIFQKLSGNYWEPIRTIWPYKDGWGVWNPTTHTVLETGLKTKEQAQAICDLQNKTNEE